jgi:UPF0271 protein
VPSVDLNADVGEAVAAGRDGGADDGGDAVLLGLVTSASVACGFHAGDPSTMRRTVQEAARRGVVVGAHPSYPDRAGFGRHDMDVPPARVADEVLYQVGALDALARASGTAVRYVKPHGALYHRLATDADCASAVASALHALGDLVVLAPPGAVVLDAAAALGMAVATEAFADRAYRADGGLVPRAEPGAVIHDPAEVARRAVALAVDHRVATVDGTELALEADSICLHGDTPGAEAIARRVRHALEEAGVTLCPFAS